jgi:hypothetical protein
MKPATLAETVRPIDDETASLLVPVNIRRKPGHATVILPAHIEQQRQKARKPDTRMVAAFTRAWRWKRLLESGKYHTIRQIIDEERIPKSHGWRIYRLNMVAPDIVAAILAGTQPEDLRLQHFYLKPVPDLWDNQRRRYGFTST